ncbi:alpha-1,2-glucosyltransferase, glycosyltransferase family protein [Rhizoctonia solani AG-3 Rhs1AP]|uniref:Dol-P-Glc:Glc(2)Man(9)GlcNAc(2)-PP-Dol alpha-1,2-glucosyltransferase n=1 Tax=Rhizoctonia solani AG-3 Rhs1AP TaxID=1086054 RepID=X8JSZ4_9AGAM|nr:alpha-1,2-glucosyltransferase, glycosyltransferase family protein [Rhizoctonia solani AG-3 Rhs1AP]
MDIHRNTLVYAAYAVFNVMVAKEVNDLVQEPYMDEPFHIPQAQAYCRGEWDYWDPKLTTPPGLYILSVVLKKVFLFKCTIPILRMNNLLLNLMLPPLISHCLALYRSDRPPRSLIQPTVESIAISAFPIAWFFSFLYYTELGSVVFVLATILAAGRGAHVLAALTGAASCTFRQTNIVWVAYAAAFGILQDMRRRRTHSQVSNNSNEPVLYDPMALDASLSDIPIILFSVPAILPSLIQTIWPYVVPVAGFASFVFWNGGIVLGDKSNHTPTLHVPQLYYFVAFASLFGFPVLISAETGIMSLIGEVTRRMFGGTSRVITSVALTGLIMISIYWFTIQHPFLLADNRHYTFYIWRRVYLAHWSVPYLLAPVYLACAWAWFLRAGKHQTLLQTLLLPICLLPTLLPTPLIEPRYFLIPYIILRLQARIPNRAVVFEAVWYGFINWATMFVFLYMGREGVGRFMW